MRLTRLLAAAIIGAGISPSLAADPKASPEVLVEEKVYEEMGETIPDGGEINLRFMSRLPDSVVGISSFIFDSRNGRFRADFITDEGLVEPAVGMAVVEIRLPVPTRRIDAGTIIDQGDIAMTSLPSFQVNSMAMTDLDQLLGMQARRTLAVGRPIQEQAIGAPIVASRGSTVTIRLKEGPIGITVPGRLLEDAARGEVVRVINNVSSQTVEAHVVDADTVEIRF